METSTQAFESEIRLNELLRRLEFPVLNITRLMNAEGINTARVLAETKLEDLESSMKSVNSLFGSHAAPARRIYFAPIRIRQLKALSAYFKRCISTYRIPDIRIINSDTVNQFVQNLEVWTESSGNIEDIIKQTNIKFETSKFTKFREKIEALVTSVKGLRGVSLDYLIRNIDQDPLPTDMIEDPSPNINSLEFMRLNTTHFGPEYDKDNQDLYNLLRSYLTGTPGWNIISKYQRSKNGRDAYLALREHYEGSSFHDLKKSKANNMMLKTFYRGDTLKFKWQNFVDIHLEAHRLFYEAGEELSDTIKILNFKSGIRPEAGLESTIEVARATPAINKNFEKFVNHLTEGVANRRSREEMFRASGNIREVAAYGRGFRGRGGRGRGRGRNQPFRGRGRGRAGYRKRPHNIPDKIIVEGMELYPSKSYSSSEYQNLSYKQKSELRKARNGYQIEQMDSRSISAAITQGIHEALNTNDEASSVTQSVHPITPNDQNKNSTTNVNVSSNVSSSTSTDQFRNRRGRH